MAVADSAGTDVSVTVTVKLDVPAEVGAPEITPLVPIRLRPAGRPPELTAHVYGVSPPAALSVVDVKLLPTFPDGRDVVVIVRFGFEFFTPCACDCEPCA